MVSGRSICGSPFSVKENGDLLLVHLVCGVCSAGAFAQYMSFRRPGKPLDRGAVI